MASLNKLVNLAQDYNGFWLCNSRNTVTAGFFESGVVNPWIADQPFTAINNLITSTTTITQTIYYFGISNQILPYSLVLAGTYTLNLVGTLTVTTSLLGSYTYAVNTLKNKLYNQGQLPQFEYTKITNQNQINNILTNVNNPLNVDYRQANLSFRYYVDAMNQEYSNSTAINVSKQDYSFNNSYRIAAAYLVGDGVVKRSSIKNVLKSSGIFGSPTFLTPLNYTTLLLPKTTTINIGNNLIISGFTNEYTVINGQQILQYHDTDLYNPSKAYTPERNYLHAINLILLTNTLPNYDPKLHGYGFIEVYQPVLTPTSEYKPLIASLIDIFLAQGNTVHAHISLLMQIIQDPLIPISSGIKAVGIFVPPTYSSINNVANQPYLISFPFELFNVTLSTPFLYNQTLNISAQYLFLFNNRFSIPVNYPIYNIVGNNYLQSFNTIWFQLTGPPPVGFSQALLISQGYLSYGSVFQFQVSSVNVPPGPMWQTLNDFSGFPDFLLFFGVINQIYTSGQQIGYLGYKAEAIYDNQYYMTNASFNPSGNITYTSRLLYATIGQYFVQQRVTKMIFDDRVNDGGNPIQGNFMTDMFGSYRRVNATQGSATTAIGTVYPPAKGNVGNPNQIRANNYTPYFCRPDERIAYVYAQPRDLSSILPNCIMTGTPTNPFRIYFLVSKIAVSNGDLLQNTFRGEKLDGNLGANTFCYFIGDCDSALNGSSTVNTTAPINNDSRQNIVLQTAPLTVGSAEPFVVGINTSYYFGWEEQLVQCFQSKVGSSLLSQYQDYSKPLYLDSPFEMFEADIGYRPPLYQYINGGSSSGLPSPNNTSTWRDTWLEKTIRIILNQLLIYNKSIKLSYLSCNKFVIINDNNKF